VNPARRRDYLRAMGIDVWLSRSQPVARDSGSDPLVTEGAERSRICEIEEVESVFAQRVVVGPGDGNTLLFCGGPDEAATALAADIARSLEGEPVWSWPASGASLPDTTLADAIETHLFTRVLIFGKNGSSHAAGMESKVAGHAHLILADAIPVLQTSGAARRRLWEILNASQWCTERPRTP